MKLAVVPRPGPLPTSPVRAAVLRTAILRTAILRSAVPLAMLIGYCPILPAAEDFVDADGCFVADAPLTVTADFEGGSVSDVQIDQERRSIRFKPGGDPVHGWPCWWYFRIAGLRAGETITLHLQGSTATLSKDQVDGSLSSLKRPLAPSWAMPRQATYSLDGRTWLHTEPGERGEQEMVYTLRPESDSVLVAWGPPYTPATASQFVQEAAESSPYASADVLCESRGGRPVPMLVVQQGERKTEDRFGVWVQARQHAWESGSSWVAQGFAEWLLSDDAEAAWLRERAEVRLVPIMDIDNTATGNGGKDALPRDHNRDWAPEPHWNEVRAAQRQLANWIDQGRMDVFLDLHNPAPGDPTFFYILPSELLPEKAATLRDRFIELAYARISRATPRIPMSSKPKVTGAGYHPLWRQISSNWVGLNGNEHTVSLCLETGWNFANCTTEGYRAVGGNLAAAVREYLAERAAAR